MKTHYNEKNETKHMHCYILDSNTVINHKHVNQTLINIDFNKKFDTSIVLKVHALFADHTKFQKMILIRDMKFFLYSYWEDNRFVFQRF